jgi:hypothetical protein
MLESTSTSSQQHPTGWLGWTVASAVVCVLANPLHEVGHWLGFRVSGIPAAISLDHTYFTSVWAPSFPGALGGPLMSVVAAWTGIALLYYSPPLHPLGAALALFMPMTRLVPYAIFAANPRFPMMYNDEGVMGLDTGLRPWTWVFILLPGLIVPLVLLWRSLPWSVSRKLAFVVGGAAAWYIVGFRVEAMLLDPLLFPQAQARELVMPHAPVERRPENR